MDLYIDQETKKLITAPNFPKGVESLHFKRGDSTNFTLTFLDGGNPVLLDGTPEIILALKQWGDYDGDSVLYTKDFTEDVDHYTTRLNFNTIPLNELLEDDASVTTMFEITWSIDGGDNWSSSNTTKAVIDRDVITGNEGIPVEGSPSYPTPEELQGQFDGKLDTSHGEDTDNPHNVTKEQVGLGNVDNTADVDKPVSTAQEAIHTALQGNIDSHVGDTTNPHNVTKEQIGLGAGDSVEFAELTTPILKTSTGNNSVSVNSDNPIAGVSMNVNAGSGQQYCARFTGENGSFTGFAVTNKNGGKPFIQLGQGSDTAAGFTLLQESNTLLRLKGGNALGSNLFTWKSNGNVGIGTDDPSAKLHVVGGVNSSTQAARFDANQSTTIFSSTYAGCYITNTDQTNGNYARINFGDGDAPATAALASRITDHSANTGNLEFWTRGDTYIGQRMVITPDGNVGIGTDNPSTKLDVAGDTNIDTDLTVGGDINAGGLVKGKFAGFRVSNTNTNSQVIPATTWTHLTTCFDSVDFDPKSGWNNGTKRFQPTVAGYYDVQGIWIANFTGTNGIKITGLYKNGSLYSVLGRGIAIGGALNGFGGSDIVYMDGVNDYIELYAYQATTASVSTYHQGGYNRFSANYLGE